MHWHKEHHSPESKVILWKTSGAERCLSQLVPELWHPLLPRGDHLCPSDCYPSPFCHLVRVLTQPFLLPDGASMA